MQATSSQHYLTDFADLIPLCPPLYVCAACYSEREGSSSFDEGNFKHSSKTGYEVYRLGDLVHCGENQEFR